MSTSNAWAIVNLLFTIADVPLERTLIEPRVLLMRESLAQLLRGRT
jgi:hypothetical protein